MKLDRMVGHLVSRGAPLVWWLARTLFVALMVLPVARARTDDWRNTTKIDSWWNPFNWTQSVPTAGTDAVIDVGPGAVIPPGYIARANSLVIGTIVSPSGQRFDGYLDMNATIAAPWFPPGVGPDKSPNGRPFLQVVDLIRLGSGGAYGQLQMLNSTVVASVIECSREGPALFRQRGGTVAGAANFARPVNLFVGSLAGSSGTYRLEDGQLKATLTVGRDAADPTTVPPTPQAKGVFVQSGGTAILKGVSTIGEWGDGTYQLSAGKLMANSSIGLATNAGSKGVFQQTGGSAIIDGRLNVAANAPSTTARLELNGTSTVMTVQGEVRAGPGFDWSGGTGTVQVTSGARLEANAIKIGGGCMAGPMNGLLKASAGVLIDDGAKLAPGETASVIGTCAIEGDLTMAGKNCELQVDVEATDAGKFDRVTVTDTATLAGALVVNLHYAAAVGDSFAIMAYGTVVGEFDRIVPMGMDLPDGLCWELTYGAATLTLTAVQCTASEFGVCDDGRIESGWTVQYPSGSSDFFSNSFGPAPSGTAGITAVTISVLDFGTAVPAYPQAGVSNANLTVDPTGNTPDVSGPGRLALIAPFTFPAGSFETTSGQYTSHPVWVPANSLGQSVHAWVQFPPGDFGLLGVGGDTTTIGGHSYFSLDGYATPAFSFFVNWGLRVATN